MVENFSAWSRARSGAEIGSSENDVIHLLSVWPGQLRQFPVVWEKFRDEPVCFIYAENRREESEREVSDEAVEIGGNHNTRTVVLSVLLV
jgi:hypothetical protein